MSRRALLAAGVLSLARPAWGRDALVVFAAVSLKPALDRIAHAFAQTPVTVSYGGSGTLARQVAAGAPADVVVLAATDWMDWLAGQGVLAGPPRTVATNRLVLAGPPGAEPLALQVDAMLERLAGGRFAMGDPMSVPAGRYGQQALETLGLWPALAPRALMAENVRAALAYVARGDVPLGLVYASDARGTGVEIAASIPARAHARITYPGATTRGAAATAGAFLDHLVAARDLFAAHGFAEDAA
ncbi:molybdate ABC transporter substrate-binding protein [Jannaschia sp. S6380]|uniref:molybdate ABC transporter substrate-binding protein n=1 Tax=Jannaschia sp. S6380 TaxID=2926408 RepID=UPI001FF232D6|nr:molybdate ABC transporter substrate-binding protein [Jannaschia sp. S6380]MCK0166297.1 molybdate ABC transporter substrate-binding protein [Jannaschia sp. S6380]